MSFFVQHAAGRVLRRIQDDELRAVVNQPGEFVDVEPEIHLLAQLDRHRFRAEEVDHRLVNRESGIGVDDLVPFFDQREDGEEDDGLAAGDNDHFFGCRCYAARLTHILSDRLAQRRHPGGRPVVGEALVQGIARRLDDVARGIEIGLPDLEMDDVAALGLQRARFHQHFEGGLGAETRHAFRRGGVHAVRPYS